MISLNNPRPRTSAQTQFHVMPSWPILPLQVKWKEKINGFGHLEFIVFLDF